VRPGIDTRRQARVERIKAQAKFSADIGSKLKIDTGKFEAANYKAELGRARQTGNFVTIRSVKPVAAFPDQSVSPRQRRQISAKSRFLFRTPAIDTSPGKSELKYTARAVMNGKEIGQPSDAVSVTVS